jgi:hypothetical protein
MSARCCIACSCRRAAHAGAVSFLRFGTADDGRDVAVVAAPLADSVVVQLFQQRVVLAGFFRDGEKHSHDTLEVLESERAGFDGIGIAHRFGERERIVGCIFGCEAQPRDGVLHARPAVERGKLVLRRFGAGDRRVSPHDDEAVIGSHARDQEFDRDLVFRLNHVIET